MDKLPNVIPTDKIISRITSFSGTRISKVGLEIEGEFLERDWKRTFSASFGGGFHSDGTVNHCDDDVSWHEDHPVDDYETLEFNSLPVLPYSPTGRKYINDLFDELGKDNRYHWNKSAGFHIHVSFMSEARLPEVILDNEFVKAFSIQLQKQFPSEWNARKNSEFCIDATTKTKDDDALKDYITGNISLGRGTRYQMINMVGSWSDCGRKTIEFRIWPTNEPKKMKEYLLFTINFLNIWLGIDNERLFEVRPERGDEELKDEVVEATRAVRRVTLDASSDRKSLSFIINEADLSTLNDLLPTPDGHDDLRLAPTARSAISLARLLKGEEIEDDGVVVCLTEKEFQSIR